MTAPVIHIDGDSARAFTYGDWLLVRDAAEGGPSWLGMGWYDDELVRTPQGWRISKRVCRLTSWSGNPLVPQPAYEQHPVMDTFTVRSTHQQGEVEFLQALANESVS